MLRLIPPAVLKGLWSFPLRELEGQETQRCLCAVICRVTNFSRYFHNEMYYFNRESLLGVDFSVVRQAALLLSCMALAKEFRWTFHLFCKNAYIYYYLFVTLRYYIVNSVRSKTISSLNSLHLTQGLDISIGTYFLK